MSFLSKISGIFTPKKHQEQVQQVRRPKLDPTVEELLLAIMGGLHFRLEYAEIQMIQFLSEKPDHIALLFNCLTHPLPGAYAAPRAEAIGRLLLVLHRLLLCREFQKDLACEICDRQIIWFKQNNAEMMAGDRLMTEPSFSSLMPAQQQQTQTNPNLLVLDTPKEVGRQQLHIERSSGNKQQERKREKHFQTQQKLNTDNNEPLYPMAFIKLYYNYLQKIGANFELYLSAMRKHYPTKASNLDNRVKFLWLFKLQNLMSTGLKLLEIFIIGFTQIQQILYDDMIEFQEFLAEQVGTIIENYILLPLQDALSLYEMYQDTNRYASILTIFREQSNRFIRAEEPIPVISVDPALLQDFLNYTLRIKLLSQQHFKKALRVPSRFDPFQGFSYTERVVPRSRIQLSSHTHYYEDEEEEKKTEPCIETQINEQAKLTDTKLGSHKKTLSGYIQ